MFSHPLNWTLFFALPEVRCHVMLRPTKHFPGSFCLNTEARCFSCQMQASEGNGGRCPDNHETPQEPDLWCLSVLRTQVQSLRLTKKIRKTMWINPHTKIRKCVCVRYMYMYITDTHHLLLQKLYMNTAKGEQSQKYPKSM